MLKVHCIGDTKKKNDSLTEKKWKYYNDKGLLDTIISY